jgi:nucleoid DNA-binding protein
MAKKANNKTSASKAMTKSAIFQKLAESTGLSRKQVGAVFDSLNDLIKGELGRKGGGGVFTIPGLVKLTVKVKEAVPAGPRMDPFTKTMKNYPAKPASKRVRARALKGLNNMVN